MLHVRKPCANHELEFSQAVLSHTPGSCASNPGTICVFLSEKIDTDLGPGGHVTFYCKEK